MTDWPSWVLPQHDSKLIGIATDHTGTRWAFIEEPYETSLRKIVPVYFAYGDNGFEEILNFWSSERPTLEHFIQLMEMGFPQAGIGIPFLGNWSCERLNYLFNAYKKGISHEHAA